jgi:UDP-3-O-[3-hydroxymyristoyl] N-acetylglucosamine deacetylase
LNNRLLVALMRERDAWEEVTFEDESSAPIGFTKPLLAG